MLKLDQVYEPVRTPYLLGKLNFSLRICGIGETRVEEDLMMEASAFPGWIVRSLMSLTFFLLYYFTQNLNLFLLDL